MEAKIRCLKQTHFKKLNSQLIKLIMMKFLKPILIPVAILAVLALSMSSCNRGYGCPMKMQAQAKR
jgi:hypothetical protein